MVHGTIAPTTADVIAGVAHHVAEVITVIDHGGVVRWANEGLRRVLGWDPGEVVGRHAAELAHPDDVPLGLELLVSAKATGPGVKEPVVYRLAHADGRWIDLDVVASNVRTADGELVLVVTARPSAQMRPATAIFDEASGRVSAMFDHALIGLAQVSLTGEVLRANHQLARTAGAAGPAELLGRSFPTLIDPDDRAVVAEVLGGEGAVPADVRLLPREGTPAVRPYVRIASTLVRDHRGQPLYYAVQLADITDLKLAERELRHRATHDPLTGLANRHALADLPTPEDGPLTLLFVDLDRFKGINDRHGHAVGDEVLVTVARRLQETVRKVDLVVRLGGDEFVVVCPGTERVGGEALARRVAAAVSRPVATAAGALTVSASVGVSTGDARGIHDLLHLADGALYRAKATGGVVTTGG